MLDSEIMLARRSGVTGGKTAKEWLKALPLSDARSAHHAVSAMLAELGDADMPARDRLAVLETVRGQVAEIDAQYAKRHADRALPLGPAERSAFGHAQSQWRALAAAYLVCFEAALEDASIDAAHRALCLARAAGYFCEAQKGHLRAGQPGASDLVEDLQRLVELAGEHSLDTVRVRDSLHPRGATSVALTYRRAALIALAGPACDAREREAAFDLSARWESRLEFVGAPAAWRAESTGAWPATVQAAPRQRLRALRVGMWAHVAEVSRLSRSLRRRMRMAGGGAGFADVRLPETFREVDLDRFLPLLHRLWCEEVEAHGEPAPASPRTAVDAQAVALAYAGEDFAALHFMVTGLPFAMNQETEQTSRQRFDEMFVFQRASVARAEHLARDALRQFEDWHIVEHGACEFRLSRNRPGARFRAGQLVGLRLRGALDKPVAALAVVRRLAEPATEAGGRGAGALDADVELLAGLPHAVGVRDRSAAPAGTKWSPGFRLGSLHARGALSLVLPRGWFRQGRQFEMHDAGVTYRLGATGLARRGADFEQIEAAILT